MAGVLSDGGSFRKNSFWLLAIGCWPGGNPDFEMAGLKLDAVVGWTRLVTPPFFGVAASPTKSGG